MSIEWLDKDELLSVAIKQLQDVEVVLDIGCGIMPQKFLRPLVHICCEPFGQYVEVLQTKTKDEYDRTYVIINAGWADAVRLFPPKSVDTVFLVDVIEHLQKEEALGLLKATEIIARRQIAVFTPLGFMPQQHPDGKDAWGLSGAQWQEHKSGWHPEDFDESWNIYAVRNYHSMDNMGRRLESPFGAMWAFKTFVDPNAPTETTKLRQRIKNITDISLDIRAIYVLNALSSLMKLVLAVKRSKIGAYASKVFRGWCGLVKR